MKKIVAFGLSAIMLAGSVSSSLSSCADNTPLNPMTIPNVKIKFTPTEFREFPDLDEESGVFYSKSGKFEWEIPADQKDAIPQNAIIKIYPKKVNTRKSLFDKASTVILTTAACTLLKKSVSKMLSKDIPINAGPWGMLGSTVFETIRHFVALYKDKKYNKDWFNFNAKTIRDPLSASLFNLILNNWLGKSILGDSTVDSWLQKLYEQTSLLGKYRKSSMDVKIVSIKEEEDNILSGKIKKEDPISGLNNFTHNLVANDIPNFKQQRKGLFVIKKEEEKERKQEILEKKKRICKELFKNAKGFDKDNPIILSFDKPSVTFRYVINGGDAANLYEALTNGRSEISDLKTEFTYEYLVPVPQNFNKKKYKSVSSGIINLEDSPEKLVKVEPTKKELAEQKQQQVKQQEQEQVQQLQQQVQQLQQQEQQRELRQKLEKNLQDLKNKLFKKAKEEK